MSDRRKITASLLKHRVTLQQENKTADGQGGYIQSWSDVAVLWAEIMPMATSASGINGSGSELFQADQIQPLINYKMLVRYRSDIHAGMRFTFDERIFNIRVVVNSKERNETLELLVVEGSAA